MLAQDRIQDAIAQGYHDAIVQYFARLAEGTPLEWPVPAIGASYAPPAAEPTPTPTPTPEPGWRRPRPVQMF
jgi:hypothetical protein